MKINRWIIVNDEIWWVIASIWIDLFELGLFGQDLLDAIDDIRGFVFWVLATSEKMSTWKRFIWNKEKKWWWVLCRYSMKDFYDGKKLIFDFNMNISQAEKEETRKYRITLAL